MSATIGPKFYYFADAVFYTDPRSSNLIEIKNRLSGTLTGTTNVGSSILYNGTTDYISFPFYTGIQTNVVTVDCWFKPTTIGLDSVLFSVLDWSNYNPGLPARGYALTWSNSTFKFQYGIGSSGPTNVVRTSSAVSTLNKWCNILVTNNLGVTNFYFNGTLLSTFGTTTNVGLDWTYGSGAIPNITISRMNNVVSGFFAGNIGPIKVYNRVLTATEASRNYNQLKARFV